MVGIVCFGGLLVGGRTVWAFQQPVRERLPNLDKRQSQSTFSNAVPAAKLAAMERVRGIVPGARVDFDGVTGAPKWIGSTSGFLTGPDGKGLSPAALAAVPAQDPYRVTKAFIQEHRNLFGHGPEALEAARIKREYVTPHNGMKTVVWEQQLDNITVFDSTLISHITRNGELVSVSSSFLPDLMAAAEAGTPGRAALQAAPAIQARRAVALAAASLAESVKEDDVAQKAPATGAEQRQQLQAPGLKGDVDAWLTWLPMNAGALRLCWDVILTSRTRGEMFRVLVDVQTGEVLLRRCLTDYISDASYRVFTSDSPSPLSPGYPTPVTNQPPLVARTLVTLPALDTNASPAGWINDGGNETLGNNVDAHTDWNNDDMPDLPRPQGSPFRVFDFTMDLATQDPTNYSQAAVVQLFYLCNWYHDKLYELGFTEAAGNFQSNNFARGGLGNDAVQADAQDGSGTDNANFSTPPDGSPGRMQMYIFTQMSPRRDGDLDAEIVFHEHTHGLSWRLVGGGQGLGTTQSDGMGEGWSDFYGLALLSEAGDDVNGNYAAGAYASYKIGGASDLQNYYFGIRRYPYTTDMSRNPLTFNDIDPAQADNCSSGAPYHTAMFGTCSAADASEVHNEGEVWCVTLWDARANLINKYGWATGNQLILQLVTDGMKLTPMSPNFLQARDAILQADLVDTGGANRNELWAAFAKRGMGYGATSPSSSTTTGVHESFDLPDDLRISPDAGFTSRGPVGGPFTPNSLTLTLTNVGSNSFTWTLVNTSAWLNVSPTSGTLTPGGPSALVTAGLDASANSFPMGVYSTTVSFTNLASGVRQGRTFALRVGQPDYYTELFDAGDNDLDFQSWTFTPDGSASFYSVCREVAASFPTDPTGGTTVLLSDDSYAQVTLTGTNTVAIYNRRTNVFFIGSNGYLTMNSGDSAYTESIATHFNRPRISACFDDLNPASGGTVSWIQTSDRVAVTFANVREYGTTATVSFQIEMFYDGRLRLTYLGVGITDGLAGLSAGNGVPADFEESDFTSYSTCPPPDALIVTPNAGFASQGCQGGPFTPSGTTYVLSNVGTNPLIWSASCPQAWVPVLTNTSPNAVRVIVINSPQSIRFFRVVATTFGVQPVLSKPSYAAGQFQFTLSGQTNATYIIEASTDLLAQGWVTVNPSGGSLAPGTSTNVNVLINANAQSLSNGVYTATVNFRNLMSGVAQGRPVTLTVLIPALSIADASVLEGNSGQTNMMFAVQLWPPSPLTVTVNFATTNGTAQAGSDYVATSGVLSFAPGQTNVIIPVAIYGDTNVEPNETFFVNLTSPSNAVLARAQATGTILTDEVISGLVGIPLPEPVAGGTNEFNAIYGTLTNLGFAVQVVTQGQWAGVKVVVSYPGCISSSFGPSLSEISNGVCFVQISDWGSDWTPNIWASITEAANITVSVDAAHPITSGLPASWTARGFWRYGYPSEDYVGWSTDVALPSLASEASVVNQSRVLVANSLGNGRAVYIGWNVYGPDAGANDLAVLRNAISWVNGSDLPTPPIIWQQPTNQTVMLGGTATFNVGASGSNPLSYQWRKDGTNLVDGGRTSGAVSNRLTIVSVQTNDAGAYSAMVTNLYGSAFSTNAVLTVQIPPPPSMPTNPIPTNGAIGVSVHTMLAWNGGGAAACVVVPNTNTNLEGDSANAFPFNIGRYGSPTSQRYQQIYAPNQFSGLGGTISQIRFRADATSGQAFPPTNMNVDIYLGYAATTTTNPSPTFANNIGPQYTMVYSGSLTLSSAATGGPPHNFDIIVDVQDSFSYDPAVGPLLLDVFMYSRPYTTYFDASSASQNATARIYASGSVSDPSGTVGYNYGLVTMFCFDGATPLELNEPASSMAAIPRPEGEVVFIDGEPRLIGGEAPPTPVGNGITSTLLETETVPTTYNVYLGTNPATMTLIATNLTQTTCNPYTLAFNTTYYWQVVASNVVGSIAGPVWTFTTTLDEVHFASATNSVAENGGSALITVVRENPAGGALSVEYATTNGTATAGSDYTAVSGTLQFPAGVMSTNFQVPILDDSLAEGNETVLLRLSQPSPNVLLATPSNAVLTIVDDDVLTLCEALDACQLTWTTGGDAAWFPQTTNTHDGVDAAQSGHIGDSQQTWLETTVTGPGTLSFWWKVSSESCCDPLTFYVDGVYQADIRGVVDWAQPTFSIAAGTHTLRWTYSKDGSVASGLDAGWVDQVLYVPTVGVLHHFTWGTIAPTQQVNVPFPVSLTAQDGLGNAVTNFAGPVALSGLVGGGVATNTILGSPVDNDSSSGTYTLGFGFTPNTNFTVTHVRSYSGTKVSIWTDAGVLLATQNVSGSAGVWTETPLATPLALTAGTTYRVGFYTGGGIYYWNTDRPSNFPNGTLVDGYYYTYADDFPTDFYGADRVIFLCDLRYTVGSYTNIPIAPTMATNFVGGVWTGNVAVLAPGAGICLAANDGSNHFGFSTPFSVIPAIPPGTVVIFTNPAFHLIQGDRAQPYPSTILVTNLGSWVNKVTVTLSNLAHTYPYDLDILLVGPGGQMVMLMSDAVGGSAYGFTNLTLTFDDDASLALPENGPVMSRSYRPTAYDPRALLPAPAPLGPYGTNLSVFAHTNANGLWSLYIADDYPPADDGVLANGWSLRFDVLLPVLGASLQGINMVVSWPASFSGQLEWTSDLNPPVAWTLLSPQPPIVQVGGRNTMTLPTTAANRFYRLRPD